MSAPPGAADSSSGSAPLASDTAPREQRRVPAVRRRRRRRRLLIASPFIALLLVAVSSYTAWMLQPTSMSWSERSTEWIRNEVPFGNSMVDQVEHVYYSLHAPKTGGPQLKRLPTVGLKPSNIATTTTQPSPWPPPITPIFARRYPAKGSGGPPARRLTEDRPC